MGRRETASGVGSLGDTFQVVKKWSHAVGRKDVDPSRATAAYVSTK
jgi:hypothetical protein